MVKSFKSFVIATMLLTAFLAWGAHALFWSQASSMQELYSYQKEKIQSSTDAEIVFVGDSSVGNAVDAKLLSQIFGLKVLNLALTENTGFMGDYLLIKELLASGHRPQFVVMMHTPAMFGYPIEVDNYALFAESLWDWGFVQHVGVEKLWNAFFKVNFALPMQQYWRHQSFAGPDMSERIAQLRQEDYYPQRLPIPVSQPGRINAPNPEKLFFLKRIQQLLKAAKIPLFYMHPPLAGPHLRKANPMLRQIDNQLKGLGVMVIDKRFALSAEDIGDAFDHVRRSHRPEYTKKIAALLHGFIKAQPDNQSAPPP